MELCLGTVQFGMNYGINNQIHRQPTWEESFTMLDEAVAAGITTIDTARAYGEAELVLGEWIRNNPDNKRLKYISKLRPNVVDDGEKDIRGVLEREVIDSLTRMRIDQLDGYLLHTPEYIYRKDIVDALHNLKDKGYTKNIGISIYDIKEGEEALGLGIMDYLQMPYSILDQRGIKEGFIQKCKKTGITTYTRSAFLQGLFFMREEDIPQHMRYTLPYIKKINQITNDYNIDIATAAIQFVKNQKYIDYLVFGVEKISQIKEDIEIFNKDIDLKKIIKEIEESFDEIEKTVIFPSLWSNGRKAD